MNNNTGNERVMMKDTFLSIIIPIYNVDVSLLDICIESILNQSFKNYEIIIVNDGSTNGSELRCKYYGSRDERVKVIDKPNGGVSSARNIGIENSTGSWILFIDADDWINEDALKDVCIEIRRSDVDMVFFGYYKNFEDKEKKVTCATLTNRQVFHNPTDKIELQKKIIASSAYGEHGARATAFRSIWATAFKRELLLNNNLLFLTSMSIGEDLIFRLYASQYANAIMYSDYCYYHYRNNQKGASCIYRETAEYDSLLELKNIKCFIDSFQLIDLEEAYKCRIVEIIVILSRRCYFHKENPEKYAQKCKEASRFMHSELVTSCIDRKVLKRMSLKRRMQAYLLMHDMFWIYNLVVKSAWKISRM